MQNFCSIWSEKSPNLIKHKADEGRRALTFNANLVFSSSSVAQAAISVRETRGQPQMCVAAQSCTMVVRAGGENESAKCRFMRQGNKLL